MRTLILLGASGNIGEQTLTILKRNKDYSLVAFSVGEKISKIKNIVETHPEVKGIYVKNKDEKLFKKYSKIKFYYGNDGLVELIKNHRADIMLNALVGFAGLAPTLEAINQGIDIALANKESLIVGGELVKKALKHSKSIIYPVDSEHSAIYKCLKACKKREVKEILITASGGAFRDLSRQELTNVTPEQALKHPTWKMGKKVTIDSATMLNKGFEIIEAHYLFDFPIRKIKVLMHEESHVHSILHLKDKTYIGEVNPPSMLNPIEYSLKKDHIAEGVKHVKRLEEFGPYHFKNFNSKRYPMVLYALKAIKKKGTMPCILNAVDEVCVDLFLKNMISFLDIEKTIARAFKTFKNIRRPSYDTLLRVDREAREWAKTAALLEGSL